jgi:hypothetical protein
VMAMSKDKLLCWRSNTWSAMIMLGPILTQPSKLCLKELKLLL